MADIKNITFNSKSGYQHLTFTSYSSTKNGSNWEITATFNVVCDSGTSIASDSANDRGFFGTIGGSDIGKVWFKKSQAWSGGKTYTYTVTFTIPFSTTTSVAVSLGVCDYYGSVGYAGTWTAGSIGKSGSTTYTMTLTLPTYSIKYNANGGSGTTSAQTKTYDKDLTLRANGFTAPANKTVTGYKVTFDANGGSCSTASLTSTRTAKYSFSKWNTKSDGTGTSYAASAKYTANAAATLYAIWGTAYTNNSIALPTPTYEGHEFVGWATSKDAASGSVGTYTPSAAVTLYAVWVKAEVTSAWFKIHGSWKRCIIWKRVEGTWKKCTAYVKVNNSWKK